MPKIRYRDFNFRAETLALIQHAQQIIEEYESQGFSLTVRQLYYQFVARGIIQNVEKSYKKIVSVTCDARLAGLIDWNSIEDRTRNLRSNSHWNSPAEIVAACAEQYAVDKWENQENYVEVWIEKDALVGTIEDVCERWDVPYFSCRGYVSLSEMWRAGRRMRRRGREHSQLTIIHLGDHDPSGLDMTRDVQDRTNMFSGSASAEINRIALTMDQVEQYSPPPNFAKLSDSRCAEYIAQYGDSSWELDALEPQVIAQLVEDAISEQVDSDVWDEAVAREKEGREAIAKVADALEEE